jgi:hypothetical protein
MTSDLGWRGGDAEDLEARIAALDASQADYRLAALESQVDEGFLETRGRFRSVDEQLVEIKDLIVGRHNGD